MVETEATAGMGAVPGTAAGAADALGAKGLAAGDVAAAGDAAALQARLHEAFAETARTFGIPEPAVYGTLTRTEYAVAVSCATYNQIDYIRQCLDSLVEQQVRVPYLIVVHDDASTDGTGQVAREYAEAHEDVIAIVQRKNVFALDGARVAFTSQYLGLAEYLATCEGDDYWCCAEKVQRQYDYLAAHPECSLCVHNTLTYDDVLGEFVGQTPGVQADAVLPTEDIICRGGAYLGTNSMMYRMSDGTRPAAFLNWGVGDWPSAIHLATLGTVFCFAEPMSVYRQRARGSWTMRMEGSKDFSRAANRTIIAGLAAANEYTQGRYAAAFERAIAQTEYNDALLQGDWARVSQGPCREIFRGNPWDVRLRMYLEMNHPAVLRLIRRVRGTQAAHREEERRQTDAAAAQAQKPTGEQAAQPQTPAGVPAQAQAQEDGPRA